MNANPSAVGPAHSVPVIPIEPHKNITAGIRKIICLLNDIRPEIIGLPIDWKNIAATVVNPFKKHSNGKILNDITEKAVYKSP